MSEKRRDSAGRVASALALPEWPLRRKMALALTIPVLLAATFGGLRVRDELRQADNFSATRSQVTVLRPAVVYLAAAESAIITARQRPALDDAVRVSAIGAVDVAGTKLEAAGRSADLTSEQSDRLQAVLDLSNQLRTPMAYASVGQSVSQVRQLQRSTTELIDAIVGAQLKPEPRLQMLEQAVDGRVSLAMQQFQVAADKGEEANPVDLAAELGVEAATLDRLSATLGSTQEQVLALNQQNAAHFGEVRNGGRDLGAAEAFEQYDALTSDLLDGIDSRLDAAADDARALAIANSVVTVALLVAAILLALLVSRLLLNPVRRVREGALEVANERLPAMVARIRAGEDPGPITPIPVSTHEEMGQLARAVDDMHRQAVHLAAGEARLRGQVGDMFQTLSRRNTSLINQQLGLIERLEKDEEDPNRLESLFRLDHLASRMRRTSDSLMVLADAPVTTSDTDALALGDVFQAAMAGVQDYQRVQVESTPTEKVNGTAAADIVHLMTEIVDNALAFSPPTAPVTITTRKAGESAIVEISDGGLGIAEDILVSLNDDLRSGGDVNPDTARRMGLLVVSRLAKRHDVTVSLARNNRGGTTATVLLPPALLRTRLPGATPGRLPVPTRPAPVRESVTNEPTPAASATSATPATSSKAGRTGLFAKLGRAARNAGGEKVAETVAPVAMAPAPATPVAPARAATTDPSTGGDKGEPRTGPAALPQRRAQAPVGFSTSATVAPAAAAARPGDPHKGLAALPQRRQAGGGTGAAATGGLFSRSEPRAKPAPAPVAPSSSSAPTTPATAAEVGHDGKDGRDVPPQLEVDSISAAIDAVMRLPRRQPGATRSGNRSMPGAPSGPQGGSLFQRPRTSGTGDATPPPAAVGAPGRAGGQPEQQPALELARPETSELQQQSEQVAGRVLEDVAAPLDVPPGLEAPVAEAQAAFEPHEEPDTRPQLRSEPAAHPAAHPAARPTVEPLSVLDPAAPMPAPTDDEDETPIFRSLDSNWFTAKGSVVKPWAASEVDAGWQIAEQVAEAPALEVSGSGLPVRRPGGRLVPGGVTPVAAAAAVARDPEAIRARLAAHAAGVSRGRSAGVDDSLPAAPTAPSSATSTEEAGPA